MQYRPLGRTGVQVSTLALGAMNFGTLGRTTQDDATAVVDAAIIGPRTIEHLHAQLAAADTVPPGDVLDAVDEIVASGTDLAPAEKLDTPPSLLDATLRRR
ncbi:hypothetical protein SAMN05443575_0754 [Jatrophihabitans endophyticus]|uniref:Aldo/keto reductase family protein n=1 Tax=Jatrophihabitans endophyticus TaxID=1206085 RepID=A0A1M5E0Q5_9ACTN|nr:hypothetical protein [Jatrophihabitans endophyticus]SHF72848.1 hypothetical protein SAMN05443575_0754 [Jatrophihabitans endophyticus]